jgi:hypothetical protein
MRSSERLSDAALQGLAKGLAGKGASNADCTDGNPNYNSGAPPIFSPAALRDHPGSGALAGFVDWRPAQRPQDLGRRVLVLFGRGRPVRGGVAGTDTQGFLSKAPQHWPVPPAWAVPVTPDAEQRFGSPSLGRY